jgi:hypothetical protein
MRLRGGATIAVLLTALAAAASAQGADQRYAAPGGSGPKAECPQANPCSLKDAVEGADNGDEVTVTGGTYTLGAGIVSPEGSNVDIHGDFGAPMPRVMASMVGPVLPVYTTGSRVRYLEVVNEAPEFAGGIYCHIGVTVERVVSIVGGKNSTALRPQNSCTVRDSLALASGQEAVALRAAGFFPGYTGVVRNVTALASGLESTGVTSSYENAFAEPGSYKLDLRNSIAAGNGADILAVTKPPGPGNIVVANSNFDKAVATGTATIFDAGANQTAPPLFVNAAGGDYREAAGSPTIDAGAADAQIGSLDLAGNPRSLAAAPDIGAFEVVPPSVLPLAAGEIQSLSLAPHKFRAAGAGEAIISAAKKAKAPIGATVTYSLSTAATVTFSVERRLPGRKLGKRCVKQTKANRTKRKCSRFKPVKGSFTHSGQAGAKSFKFSGRIGGKGLKPGSYRLVGKTGPVSRTASFKIVK